MRISAWRGSLCVGVNRYSDSDKQCTTYVTKSRPATEWRMRANYLLLFVWFRFLIAATGSWRWWEWNSKKKNRRRKTNEKWFSTPWNIAFVHESGASEAPTKPKSMWHKQMFVIFFFVKLFNKVFFIFTHRKVSEWKSSHKLIPNCGADERNESEGGKRKSL